MTEALGSMLLKTAAAAALAQVAQPAPLPGLPAAGGYISALKVAGMAVLVIPWAVAAPWVHRDAKRVRASQTLWDSLVLAVGAAAFAIWLLLPNYYAGLLLYVLAIAALLVSYIAYRNGRVAEDQRIHIAAMFMPRREKEALKPFTKIRLYGADGQIVPPPSEQSPENVILAYNITQDLLYDMVWRRASEAELMPVGQKANVRFVIDGVATNRPGLSLSESEAAIQYLKPRAGMSAEERRRPQRGRITVDMAGAPVEIQVSSAGTTGGQRMLFRVVQEFVQTHLDELGISPEVLERVRALNKADRGLFIVSGRPGSGITSTLYSLLREHDAFIKQLATLEAEISIDLENITHHAYRDPARLHEQLAAALRREPDVVMVDRCPDAATARLICQASQKRSMLLGMHASDSFTALAKWVKLCGDPAIAMPPLRGVLCQMLVRKLCPQCREPYRPDPQLLAKANIPAEKINVFFRPPTQPLTDEKGKTYICHACQGSGYLGRTAAFELLEVNDEVKGLVTNAASLVQIKAAARKQKMSYLQEEALKKVIAGVTSIQEVIRVSQDGKS